MTERQSPRISSRKQPKQARSAELVATILQAATQVLAKEGAARFTTARVAERAGVSIGSLYQYFPNKAAILFRLQRDEWTQTTDLLGTILTNTTQPPLQRIHTLVHAFIQSECDEAQMRVALNDAAPLYRDAPEAQAIKANAEQTMRTFMQEALPAANDAARDLAGQLITDTMSAVGKQFSETPRTPAEVNTYSEALAQMFCSYLKQLTDTPPASPATRGRRSARQ
jgi:AcrR family transcriptional regulator